MRFPTVIAVLAIAAVTALAGTAAAEAKTFKVTATDDGSDFWFEFDGVSGKNPTIQVAPGDEITVEVTGGTAGHNFHVMDPVGKMAPESGTIPVGETSTFTFTVPEGVTELKYQCDPHIALGMVGKFTTQSANPGDGDTPKESPGLGAPLAVLALAGALLLFRRR